jgi:hypothetical protein
MKKPASVRPPPFFGFELKITGDAVATGADSGPTGSARRTGFGPPVPVLGRRLGDALSVVLAVDRLVFLLVSFIR